MKKLNLCVIFGGVSTEHDISLLSAASIIKHLNREEIHVLPVGITKDGRWLYAPELDCATMKDDRWAENPSNIPVVFSTDRARQGLFSQEDARFFPIDCVFPVLHGMNGEDGTIQGLFEIAGVPFVGCGTASSAMCMDKAITKLAAAAAGVRQADWVLIRARDLSDPDTCATRVEQAFPYPVFVKPASTGSSVGVSKAKNRAALLDALRLAGQFDEKILVEEFIDGHEIETAVLGNEDVVVSCCGEILPAQEFYSFDAKYCDAASQTRIPAALPEAVAEEVRRTAERVYHALDCTGLSRVDFFVSRADHSVIFNEINTIPGFTDISMYAKLFAEGGIPFSELLDRLIDYAFRAQENRRKYK